MEQLTLLVDSREKKPLSFPKTFTWTDPWWKRKTMRIVQKDVKLSEGDYAIEGHENLVLIERKGSIRELRDNLFAGDAPRAKKAFKRLADACKYPYLLLDFSLSSATQATREVEFPDAIRDFFYREMATYGIRLLWLPQLYTTVGRRKVGEEVLRVLWGHIVANEILGGKK